jgi:hypothetical protein
MYADHDCCKQDIRPMVAVFGVFSCLHSRPDYTPGPHRPSPQADPGRDGLRSSIERNVIETTPFKADPDRDSIKDEDRYGEDDEDDKASPILDQQSLK